MRILTGWDSALKKAALKVWRSPIAVAVTRELAMAQLYI
jgi:hypothetical protein